MYSWCNCLASVAPCQTIVTTYRCHTSRQICKHPPYLFHPRLIIDRNAKAVPYNSNQRQPHTPLSAHSTMIRKWTRRIQQRRGRKNRLRWISDNCTLTHSNSASGQTMSLSCTPVKLYDKPSIRLLHYYVVNVPWCQLPLSNSDKSMLRRCGNDCINTSTATACKI